MPPLKTVNWSCSFLSLQIICKASDSSQGSTGNCKDRHLCCTSTLLIQGRVYNYDSTCFCALEAVPASCRRKFSTHRKKLFPGELQHTSRCRAVLCNTMDQPGFAAYFAANRVAWASATRLLLSSSNEAADGISEISLLPHCLLSGESSWQSYCLPAAMYTAMRHLYLYSRSLEQRKYISLCESIFLCVKLYLSV